MMLHLEIIYTIAKKDSKELLTGNIYFLYDVCMIEKNWINEISANQRQRIQRLGIQWMNCQFQCSIKSYGLHRHKILDINIPKRIIPVKKKTYRDKKIDLLAFPIQGIVFYCKEFKRKILLYSAALCYSQQFYFLNLQELQNCWLKLISPFKIQKIIFIHIFNFITLHMPCALCHTSNLFKSMIG